MKNAMHVLETVGNTPLVELRNLSPGERGRVLVKVEGANPTGSMKDRMAKAAIEGAERTGRLMPGGTVVEWTGGSTGTALALICAAKGYRCRVVTSDAFSTEKQDHMRALGAELTLIPSDQKRITEALIKAMIARAQEYGAEPGSFWVDQLNNRDASRGYEPLGEEIWQQTEGRVDAFVHAVGTAHSIDGTVKALRRHRPELHVAAVEPAESPILSQGKTGGHRIEGVGIGFVPPMWDPKIPNEIISVKSDDAHQMARALARTEALFAGASSGANVVAALQVAKRLGPGSTVVTLLVDTGLKYLTTEVYRSAARA